MDQTFDLFDGHQLCDGMVVHAVVSLKFQIGISKQVSLERVASSRTTTLSFELWLRKTPNLKPFAIPSSAEWGETDAFAGQLQNQSRGPRKAFITR